MMWVYGLMVVVPVGMGLWWMQRQLGWKDLGFILGLMVGLGFVALMVTMGLLGLVYELGRC
jgi:hypothetical protein